MDLLAGSRQYQEILNHCQRIQTGTGRGFVESFSPLATNTTIRVVLANSLEYQQKHNDWVIEMVNVEAAFLNALVDTDVYIEMPDGLI